jgi:hypothetical protein
MAQLDTLEYALDARKNKKDWILKALHSARMSSRETQRFTPLWVANDNDFVLATQDTPPIPNPNQFFVFGFTDAQLPGFVPQQFPAFSTLQWTAETKTLGGSIED